MGYFSSPRVHRCVFQGTLDVELYEKLKSKKFNLEIYTKENALSLMHSMYLYKDPNDIITLKNQFISSC